MLRLPESSRESFQKPYGRVYEGRGVELINSIEEIKRAKFLACVGDLVCYFSLKAGFKPDIAIIDGKTEREDLGEDFNRELMGLMDSYKVISAKNPRSCISEDLTRKIIEAVKNLGKLKTAIVVDGEEDLAALVLAAVMPEGSAILYGIPSVGVAVYEVGEKILILQLLDKFEASEDDEVKKMIKEVVTWS